MDPFIPATTDLRDLLRSGEAIEQALTATAEEHGLSSAALRNRAIRALGPLEAYAERQLAWEAEPPKAQERRREGLLHEAEFWGGIARIWGQAPPRTSAELPLTA